MIRPICCVLAVLSLLLGADFALAQMPLDAPFTRLPPVEESTPILPPPIVAAPAQAGADGADAGAEDAEPEGGETVEEIAPGDEDVASYWFIPATWVDPWEGSAELGLNGTEGNSQTFNVRAGAKAKYKLPWIEQTYEALHVDNSANGIKTALNGYFDGRIVWPFPDSKWAYFIHGRAEYDDFRDYDMRLSGDTGLSYDVWKTEPSNLQLRGGVSTSREIGGSENRFVPELAFGFDFTHKIDERQKVSLTTDYYPAVDDFMDDYRINTNASWEIVVSKAWGLSAKLSAVNRYDNTPQGRKANDLNYAALMMWSF
jgi:hypothetical protein